MRAVQLTIWIAIAFLIASHTEGGAEVCHSELRYEKDVYRVLVNYTITNPEIEVDPKRTGFATYYHPYGKTTTRTISGGPASVVSEKTDTGPVWEDVCGIGDDENAGYQLK